MLCDIGINLLSDLIFSLLVFIFFFAIYRSTKRIKLLRFFGIEKNKKLTIFTSNLIVEKYGSSGMDGIKYSFQGTAIPNEESRAAAQLQTLFNYFLPSQVEKPGFLSTLLISDIDVKVLPSPINEYIVEQGVTIISLGFPPYNSISRFIENSLNPSAKLDYIPTVTDHNFNQHESNTNENPRVIPSGTADGTAIPATSKLTSASIVPSGIGWGDIPFAYTGRTSASTVPHSNAGENQPIQPVIRVPEVPPFTDPSVGFIQKIIDNRNKKCLFYIAGLSENSTAGSAHYLVNNWESLEKTYGVDTSFFVLVKVSNTNNKISQIILKS